MLVNMSMVDAGYEGSLACLFVNFGRQPLDIDPGMTVARSEQGALVIDTGTSSA